MVEQKHIETYEKRKPETKNGSSNIVVSICVAEHKHEHHCSNSKRKVVVLSSTVFSMSMNVG